MGNGKLFPTLDSLMLISDKFNMSLEDLIKQIDHEIFLTSNKREQISNTLINMLDKQNIDEINLETLYSNAGFSYENNSEFNSVYEVFEYYIFNLDLEIKNSIVKNKNHWNNPFELIAYAVLPILYAHAFELKILYSKDNRVNGKWI
ncbi:MAG: hypothetical protein LBC17_00065 [Lactobacillaceae bacterium]|jgi:hypothetical protein|nr:hypothetical protein [Lactobacillaceae bacterium]